MGTSNFYYRGASKVYPVCMAYEDDVLDDDDNPTGEKETRYCDLEDFESVKDYLKELMSQSKYGYNEVDETNHSAPRSFPSSYVGEWYVTKYYNGVPIEFYLKATINSGYYDGACLDYIEQVYVSGYKRDEIEADDLYEYGDDSKAGLAKNWARYANNWLNKVRDEMKNELEVIFAKVSGVVLTPVVTFSNGETVYQKI